MKRGRLALGLLIAVSLPVGVQAAAFSWESCASLFGALKRALGGAPAKVVVTERVPGLYESIPTVLEQKIGKLQLSTEAVTGGGWFTRVVSDDGVGTLYSEIRMLPGGGHEFSYVSANLHGGTLEEERKIPSFLQVPGVVPLVKERGIPTEAYITLRHMRLGGVPLGGLRRVVARDIRNVQTGIELRAAPSIAQWMGEHPHEEIPNELVAAEFWNTASGRYIARDLVQSGHRIKSLKIESTRRGRLGPIYEALQKSPRSAEVLKAGNLRAEDEMPFNFTAIVEVEAAE